MIVSTFVVDAFKKAFSEMRKEKIVLYGLGANTKDILYAFPEFSFLGLLDSFQENGQLYGKPILSLAQVERLHPDHIVIVARAQSTRIIARRIAAFCREQGIRLWDVFGHDLLAEKTASVREHEYFAFTLEQAREEIRRHEVISFDVFDTLLMRCTLMPEDVFALVEKRFRIAGLAKARAQAEHDLYRDGNPTLEEIEHETAAICGLDESQEQQLLRTELDIEQAVLVPRHDAVALLDFAVSLGKPVYLISDMYLSESQLESLLQANNITGYAGVLISTPCQSLKSQHLFEIFKEQVPAESYLHFGDNMMADVASAMQHGIDALQLMSAMDLMEISAWRGADSWCESLEERLLLGELVAYVFNSPFALAESDGRPLLDSARGFGRALLAPLLTAFVLWMMQETVGQYGHLLWSARDGYLPLRLQRIVEKHFPEVVFPHGHYLYISRIVATAAGLHDEDDIKYAASVGFAGSAAEMLARRFFLRQEEILPQAEGESMESYVLRHVEPILQRAAELRQRYQRYLSGLGLPDEASVAIFDLISSGTGQCNLESICGYRLHGLYMIFIQEKYERKQRLETQSFMESGDLYQLQSYLAQNYEPVENLVMSDEPTLVRFDAEGRPVFAAENRSESELDYTREVQEGVCEFFARYISMLGDWRAEIRSSFADRLYQLIRRSYTRVKGCVFAQEDVRDDFTGRDYRMEDMFD